MMFKSLWAWGAQKAILQIFVKDQYGILGNGNVFKFPEFGL